VPEGSLSATSSTAVRHLSAARRKGYLCIAIPANRTFVIDHLFARPITTSRCRPQPSVLDTVIGEYESMVGFEAIGRSVTPNPHYVLSQPVHLAVTGGTRVTLIMHNYYVNSSSWITETPGRAVCCWSGTGVGGSRSAVGSHSGNQQDAEKPE